MLAAIFAVRGVVGMGRVFDRVRFTVFMMAVFFFLVFAGLRHGRLDGGRIGQRHRRQRLAGVSLGGEFIAMIVLVVSVVMIMLMVVMVAMLMMPGIVVMMLRIGMVMSASWA